MKIQIDTAAKKCGLGIDLDQPSNTLTISFLKMPTHYFIPNQVLDYSKFPGNLYDLISTFDPNDYVDNFRKSFLTEFDNINAEDLLEDAIMYHEKLSEFYYAFLEAIDTTKITIDSTPVYIKKDINYT